jgi:GNAT superfamily N-acetyltransferase
MPFSARMYSGPEDADRLVRIVTALFSPPASLWHAGDVWWGLYQNMVYRPEEHIRLWSDEDGRPLGFVWFYPPDEFSWQLLPGLPYGDLIEEDMFEWAESHGRDLTRNDALANPTLISSALDTDLRSDSSLQRQGFQLDRVRLIHMYRDLSMPISPKEPVTGIVVRQVAGRHEFEARVNLHREVWQPSKVTVEAYKRLQTAGGYKADLDLVAVSPEGTLAAYCICWLDPVNRIGEFEPVGTRLSYRRRGYGRAVMLEGLRQLKGHGMVGARLLTVADNEAALALYTAVGFQAYAREYLYVKAL